MRVPSRKYSIIFGLALAIFGIVPMVVIMLKYTSVGPISSLSLDYWLWLCGDAAGWLLIIVWLRLFPDSIADAFARAFRSSTVWIFSAIIFAASAVEGIFTGHFLTAAPAYSDLQHRFYRPGVRWLPAQAKRMSRAASGGELMLIRDLLRENRGGR